MKTLEGTHAMSYDNDKQKAFWLILVTENFMEKVVFDLTIKG